MTSLTARGFPAELNTTTARSRAFVRDGSESDRAIERSSDRASERSSDRASDRAFEKGERARERALVSERLDDDALDGSEGQRERARTGKTGKRKAGPADRRARPHLRRRRPPRARPSRRRSRRGTPRPPPASRDPPRPSPRPRRRRRPPRPRPPPRRPRCGSRGARAWGDDDETTCAASQDGPSRPERMRHGHVDADEDGPERGPESCRSLYRREMAFFCVTPCYAPLRSA